MAASYVTSDCHRHVNILLQLVNLTDFDQYAHTVFVTKPKPNSPHFTVVTFSLEGNLYVFEML